MPSSPHFSCSVQYCFFSSLPVVSRAALCLPSPLTVCLFIATPSMPHISSYVAIPPHAFILLLYFVRLNVPHIRFKMASVAKSLVNRMYIRASMQPKTRVTIIDVYTSTSTFYFENLLLNLLDHLDAPCPWLSLLLLSARQRAPASNVCSCSHTLF